jgi:hypothetical protein
VVEVLDDAGVRSSSLAASRHGACGSVRLTQGATSSTIGRATTGWLRLPQEISEVGRPGDEISS